MIVFGYAKDYKYGNDGTFQIKVRVPSIHGPYTQQAGTKMGYTRDEDLPWYTSILLPHMPMDGDVVMLQTVHEGKGSNHVVIGLTGGSYLNGATIS